MNYYKVANPFHPSIVIDTNIVNYSSTLDNWEYYSPLINLIIRSSAALHLPLNFYVFFYNQLAYWGDAYLQCLPASDHGHFHLSDLLTTRFERDPVISEKNLIEIVESFNQIGYSPFMEFHYIWELLFEQVRQESYPRKPSRRDCYFLFGSVEDCLYYKEQHHIEGDVRQVKLLETRSLLAADMRIFDDLAPDATTHLAIAQAERYWSGERSDRPIIEYLFQGKCTLESGSF